MSWSIKNPKLQKANIAGFVNEAQLIIGLIDVDSWRIYTVVWMTTTSFKYAQFSA